MSEPKHAVRRVLLVEDDEEDYEFTRELLAEIGGSAGGYELTWARGARSAIDATDEERYDVCLIDYRLGGAESGVDLARWLINDGHRMPVILLTGTDDREVDERAASIGAHDFLVKGQFSATVLDRAIRYAIQNHAALRALHDSYRTTVHALASALELRDDQTGAHATRVTELALELTRRVAPELADDPELEYGFLLHDIGKIGVPDGILLKDGPLDDRERSRMQTHVTLGQHILSDIPFLSGVASQIAAAHHERWDGTGYPNRLRGSEIPLAARIFSIIDSYDAMTSERPYRSGQPTESALAEIRREAGKQFDPQLAETFVAMIREVEARNAAAA